MIWGHLKNNPVKSTTFTKDNLIKKPKNRVPIRANIGTSDTKTIKLSGMIKHADPRKIAKK
jgi:hypothetical protein